MSTKTFQFAHLLNKRYMPNLKKKGGIKLNKEFVNGLCKRYKIHLWNRPLKNLQKRAEVEVFMYLKNQVI